MRQLTFPTSYVLELTVDKQLAIAIRLRDAGIHGDDFFRAMDSRVCDLADTIEIGDLA